MATAMKKYYILLVVILHVTKPAILSAASIYNSDFKPHQIQVKYKDGSQYHVTVYNSSTHYFRCKYGCQIKVLKTGATITLNSDTVVLIDDGKLRVR
jgi:hypothetical protein